MEQSTSIASASFIIIKSSLTKVELFVKQWILPEFIGKFTKPASQQTGLPSSISVISPPT